MSDKSINIDFTSAILMLFFVFWYQSGWYRIDCALGERKACELIQAEYIKKIAP